MLTQSTSTILYNPDQKLSFTLPPLQATLEKLLHPLPKHHTPRIQHDLATLFLFAFGNDSLPALPRVPFEHLWAAYISVTREAALKSPETVPFLVDVKAGKLDLSVLHKILVKTKEMIQTGDLGEVVVDRKIAEAAMQGYTRDGDDQDDPEHADESDSDPPVESITLDPKKPVKDLFTAHNAGQYMD
ncbi:hypothetical protein HDU98_004490, partial [Podochytrium sp. JEL0797]